MTNQNQYTGPWTLAGTEGLNPEQARGCGGDALVNLTPHEIRVTWGQPGNVWKIPSHGVARVIETRNPPTPATPGRDIWGWVPDCEISQTPERLSYGQVAGLPDPAEGELPEWFFDATPGHEHMRKGGENEARAAYYQPHLLTADGRRVWFIVSALTAAAIPYRPDVLVPHGEVRNERDAIVAVERLVQLVR